MKVATIDAKRRIVLPGALPGEAYAVVREAAGRYELTQVIPASKRPKPSAAKLEALMKAAALTPKMRWEELRQQTREP